MPQMPIRVTGPYLSPDQQARLELPLRLTPQQQMEIDRADVIIAVDEEADYSEVVYGRECLERIAATGRTTGLFVLKFPVQQDTEQVECLMAFVQVLKGCRPVGVKIGHHRV